MHLLLEDPTYKMLQCDLIKNTHTPRQERSAYAPIGALTHKLAK